MNLDLEALLVYAYKSLDVWGDEAQRTMAMGEAAEFIDVLAKHARNRATPAQVVDEAADAIIVAAVAVALAGGDSPALAERIAFKMDRTRAKMQNVDRPQDFGRICSLCGQANGHRPHCSILEGKA